MALRPTETFEQMLTYKGLFEIPEQTQDSEDCTFKTSKAASLSLLWTSTGILESLIPVGLICKSTKFFGRRPPFAEDLDISSINH